MVFTTSICANYLPRAMVLAESIKKQMPGSTFVVWLLEREIPPSIAAFPFFDEVILVKDGVDYNLEHFIFRHQVIEASTAVKGDLFKYILKRYPSENKFVYLDPDIWVYSPLRELEQLLDEHEIVLTPHLLKECGQLVMEISILEHGIFNLGFLAIRRSAEAEKLINWWTDRLHRACFDLKHIGLFTDQKWLNHATVFFDAYVLRHPGYNVGPWSLMSRGVTLEENRVLVEGLPLRFMHFSGFPDTFNQCVEFWAKEGKEILLKLSDDYAALLKQRNVAGLSAMPWSYAQYASKTPISLFARMKWRTKHYTGESNPYLMSDYKILGPRAYCWKMFEKMYTHFVKKQYSKTYELLRLGENIK
jgi:hypothetical protein